MRGGADDEWKVIEGLLPRGWSEAAREQGAFRRARYTADPAALLRLLLFHAVGGTSLDQWVPGGDLFTDAVRKIKELVDDGTLGKLLYIDSVRTNLGLFHPDHNVIFDLAPHEISIMLHLVDREPISVQAQGVCHTNNGIENLAYVHLEFDDGFIAHFHLNWLAPVKIRQMIIAGSRQMVVYDDIERSEKVKVYNKGIAIRPSDGVDAMYKAAINYRSGDMHAPHLENHEALAVEAAHFVDCVRTRKTPIVTGQDGLRIVRILEATQRSLRNQGQRVDIRSGTRRRQAA